MAILSGELWPKCLMKISFHLFLLSLALKNHRFYKDYSLYKSLREVSLCFHRTERQAWTVLGSSELRCSFILFLLLRDSIEAFSGIVKTLTRPPLVILFTGWFNHGRASHLCCAVIRYDAPHSSFPVIHWNDNPTTPITQTHSSHTRRLQHEANNLNHET